MSHQLSVKFESLMGHLNAEENALAGEFLKELEETLESLEESSQWLADLEAAGVDNWGGIDYAYDLRDERTGGDE